MGSRRRDMAASRRRLTASGPRSCFGGFVVRSAPFLAPRELASDNIAERHRRTDRRAGSWIMPAEYRVGIDSDRVEAGYRSEEHTSELPSLMRISYAVLCL